MFSFPRSVAFLCLSVSLSLHLAIPPKSVQADIYQWEWIDANDHSKGKRQSTTLCPDGAGVDAVPFAYLVDLDLTQANCIGVDMYSSSYINSNLSNADFSNANMVNVYFSNSQLAGANFTNATIRGAYFFDTSGRGFTQTQLQSTASYQAHDLTGVFFNTMTSKAGTSTHRIFPTLLSPVPICPTPILPSPISIKPIFPR